MWLSWQHPWVWGGGHEFIPLKIHYWKGTMNFKWHKDPNYCDFFLQKRLLLEEMWTLYYTSLKSLSWSSICHERQVEKNWETRKRQSYYKLCFHLTCLGPQWSVLYVWVELELHVGLSRGAIVVVVVVVCCSHQVLDWIEKLHFPRDNSFFKDVDFFALLLFFNLKF